MNRLHLHVTDSQSWPLEIPNLPELAQRGSYAIGLTYTPEDLQGILDYAEARGIQVIVEIDMPGHTTAIADAYPDLVVGKNIQPWSPWANQPPSGSLKLNSQPVRDFLTKLFNDVLPRLKAHTHTFHVGGDEINAAIYERDPGVNSNDTAVIRPHLQEFTNHVQKQVKSHQMTTFVWEELLLQWNMTLPKSTVVQTWQSDDAAKNATSKGYRVVTGNVNYWYLDCGQGL
jgi:hexosaminidase